MTLDFIIIDTMARITTERHFDELYIVSKDKGFDSIISHYLTFKTSRLLLNVLMILKN